MTFYSSRVGNYHRDTNTFSTVDFSEEHNPDDYLHYKFAVPLGKDRKQWCYESIEKARQTVVYRGYVSYHQRKKGIITTDTTDGYVNITTEDELQQKMRDILSDTEDTDE